MSVLHTAAPFKGEGGARDPVFPGARPLVPTLTPR